MPYDKGPTKVELEADSRKAFCMCGESKNKPYCDGSHAGSGLKPIVYSCQRAEEVWVCQCGKSGTKPRCDGSHNKA